MKKLVFVLVSVIALAGSLVAADVNVANAVASNGSVFSPAASFGGASAIKLGTDDKGQNSFCSILSGFDGKSFLAWQARETSPILWEAELPGGYKLTSSYSCFGTSGAYLVTPHPTLRVGANPALTLFAKVGDNQVVTVLDSGKTRFTANDPTTGKNTAYTYTQMGGNDFRRDRGVVVTASVPDSPTGSPVAAIPQLWLVEIKGATITPLFNPQVDAKTQSVTGLSTFCISNGSLYVTGQDPSQVAPTKTALALFRIVAGKSVKIKDYFEPASAQQIGCVDTGVQVYAQNANGLVFGYFADNSSVEQVFFSGSQVEGVNLSAKDVVSAVSAQELYVVSATKTAAIYINGSEARLAKTSTQNPKGNPVAVMAGSKNTLLLQTEGSATRPYFMYRPSLVKADYTGRPGDSVRFSGSDLVVEGLLPIVNLNGSVPEYSADTKGKLTVVIPTDVTVGDTLNGTVNVWGTVLGFTVQILPADAPPTPQIISVDGTVFAPRSILTVRHSALRENTENADPNTATFDLSGVSATLDGVQARLLSSGPEELSILVPKEMIGKASAKLVIRAAINDYVLDTNPVAINLEPVADKLFTFDFAGVDLPFIFSPNGGIVSQFTPAKAGDSLTAYGTGCGVEQIPEDWENPADDIAGLLPQISIGELTLTADSAVMVGGQPGVCRYKFTLPLETSSGLKMLVFASQSGAGYQLFIQ